MLFNYNLRVKLNNNNNKTSKQQAGKAILEIAIRREMEKKRKKT